MTPIEFASALMGYCYVTQGSVSSWGRTAKRNTAVGGVADSYHLDFLAGDVVYDVPLLLEVRVKHAKRFGLKIIAEPDHDHLQPL